MMISYLYSKNAIIFDLDDTLIKTNNSVGIAIVMTINDHLPKKIDHNKLKEERKKYQDRDDKKFIQHYLKNHNIDIDLDVINIGFDKNYKSIAKQYETLLVSKELLDSLSKDYDLYILTDRPRKYYNEIWGDILNKYFIDVKCFDDFDNNLRKPDPTNLKKMIEDNHLKNPIFVGNGINDMKVAKNADIKAFGIVTTNTKEELINAGADNVIEIKEFIFCFDKR